MAGDWTKMRTDLYRDPKVCIIADILTQPKGALACYVMHNTGRDMSVTRNVTRNATVGALVTVWGVMRLRGKRIDNDLIIRHGTLNVIDDLADLAGFGAAMASVEWAAETPEGLVFPNFFEHYNVDPKEEKKSNSAERQRRYRERKKAESDENVTSRVTSQSNAREEKSRVEKSNNNTNKKTPSLADDQFEIVAPRSHEAEPNYSTDLLPATTPAQEVAVPAKPKAATKPKAAKKPAQTPFPDDFDFTNEMANKAMNYWDRKGCQILDPDDQFFKFAAYHRSKGTVMANWESAWQTWYSRAAQFLLDRSPTGHTPADQTSTEFVRKHSDTSWADDL